MRYLVPCETGSPRTCSLCPTPTAPAVPRGPLMLALDSEPPPRGKPGCSLGLQLGPSHSPSVVHIFGLRSHFIKTVVTCPGLSGMSGAALGSESTATGPQPVLGGGPTSADPEGCSAGFRLSPPGRLSLPTSGPVLPLGCSAGPEGPSPNLRTGYGLLS